MKKPNTKILIMNNVGYKKRSTCIICGKKRYINTMLNINIKKVVNGQSWICRPTYWYKNELNMKMPEGCTGELLDRYAKEIKRQKEIYEALKSKFANII